MNPTTDEMERIVFEAITGKCWHDWIPAGDPAYLTPWCTKCGVWIQDGHSHNPPLATSIDAWHEHIFPVIRSWHNEEPSANEPRKIQVWLDELEKAVLGHTIDVATAEEVEAVITATAMHHLTAAYNVVKGE